ncbi:antitoxin VapB family protein [Halovivax gelatinilyticus]|uniref:antitoxin VapB family protein n=1 Tax=Halovivax gelatinilyticus TaxID=2961597 RepID=UPI0020CA520E|nr:antitoxin VapB family protein [Halovivax gelatinilyticus]
MATKTVRLDEDVYERIKSKKREDETFSAAIDRLTSDYSLLDFAGGYTDEDAARHRDLLERSEETAAEDRRKLLDRVGADGE